MDRSEEMKRRIDAALAYADMSQTKLEGKVSFSRSTLNRRRLGGYDFTPGELHEIAKATGVPAWFLEDGWKGWRKAITPEELQKLVEELPPQGDPPDA